MSIYTFIHASLHLNLHKSNSIYKNCFKKVPYEFNDYAKRVSKKTTFTFQFLDPLEYSFATS